MNTLEIVEILEKVKINKKDAINLAEAINGKSGLATKEDLHLLEGSLKEDIHKLDQSIAILKTSNKWIVTVISISFTITISLLVKIAFFG